MKRLVLFAVAALVTVGSADDLGDPTRPPPAPRAAAAAPAKPVLSAIMGGRADRVAIFNGQLVRSGGSVGPYVIELVFEDGVRYRHAGLVEELHLPSSGTIKKPSNAAARPPMGVH
jgi:hypothetical protein